MRSIENRSTRDTSPTAVGKIPGTDISCLIYRAHDSETGKTVFRWRLARRNRAGDGFYQTFRFNGVSSILDVIAGLQYLCAKFALVPECKGRDALAALAMRLEMVVSRMKEDLLGNCDFDRGEAHEALASALSPS